MKYAVLSDLHLGAPEALPDAHQAVHQLRQDGYKIILAGDIFDTWRNTNSYQKHKNILQPGDIYLPGNHDAFTPVPPGVLKEHALTIKSGGRKFFITHGDVVDFTYAATTLKAGREKQETAPWWAKLVGRFRNWKTTDILAFYRAMDSLPNWAVKSLEHGAPKPLQKLQLLAVTIALTLINFKERNKNPYKGEPRVNNTSITTREPRELVRRIEGYYPEAKQADTIIIGHLHKHADEQLSYREKSQRLITLGAWVAGSEPTIVLIENGYVKVLHA